MSALNNQTNRNSSRYFFATSENGEQTLGLQYGTSGGPIPLSTMAVTISGAGGNGVIVNQAPQFVATEFVLGDEAVCGGSASSYFTPSTLTSNFTGFNLGVDRVAGSGTVTIESYAGNGAPGGYEFLSRGVASGLISTTSVGINGWLSDLGYPGATAVLRQTGTLVTATVDAAQHISVDLPTGGGGRGCFNIADLSGVSALQRWAMGTAVPPTGGNQGSDFAIYSYLDNGTFGSAPLTIKRDTGAAALTNLSSVNAVPYPQNLVSVSPTSISPGAVAVPNSTPTVVLTIPIGTTLVAGANYLTDINVFIQATNPLANPVFLQMGVRLGGNGAFNYENPIFVPVGGIPVILGVSLGQISDMGTATANIDIIAYQQSLAPGGVINVTCTTSSGSPPHLLKMIT